MQLGQGESVVAARRKINREDGEVRVAFRLAGVPWSARVTVQKKRSGRLGGLNSVIVPVRQRSKRELTASKAQ